MKKKEKIYILGLLFFALLFWGCMMLLGPKDYRTVRITVNGELFGTYSLLEDQTIPVGDTNICQIKDGKISMIHAQCPDQLCVHQGPIDQTGGMIVCLPNKVTIEGVREEINSKGVDAVS